MEIVVQLSNPQKMYDSLGSQEYWNREVMDIARWFWDSERNFKANVWIAFTASNNRGLSEPVDSTFFYWSNEELWNNVFLPNLARLCNAMRMCDMDRICWNSGIYPGSGNSKEMNKEYAWLIPPEKDLIISKARAVYERIRGMQLGTYVWLKDALKFKAFLMFHREVFKPLFRMPILFDEGGYIDDNYNSIQIRKRLIEELPYCTYIQGDILTRKNASLSHIKDTCKTSKFFYDWDKQVW